MVDYREFSRQIKEKYPEYQDVDDLKLANAMIEKYPEYKPQVTFENAEIPLVQVNEDGTEKKILQGRVELQKPIRPRGIGGFFDKNYQKQMTNYENEKFKQDAQDWLQRRDEWEERHPIISGMQKDLQPGYRSIRNDNELWAKYGLPHNVPFGEQIKTDIKNIGNEAIPALNMSVGLATGGGGFLPNLSRFGRGLIQGEIQGAALSGTHEIGENGLSLNVIPKTFEGARTGGILGGILGTGAALKNAIVNGTKNFGYKLLGGMAQLQPETVTQAIKPTSKALDLNTQAKAQDAAYNLTNRIKNTYNEILKNRADDVATAAKKLDKTGERINVADVFNDIDTVHNDYQYGRGNFIDDINPNIAKQNKNIVQSRLAAPEDILGEINQPPKPDFYSKAKEEEAFKILSEATGKPVNWLKSQLKATTDNKGVIKRAEGIENLLDNVDDKLDLTKMGNTNDYQYYHNANLGYNNNDANAGYELARQAYDDIVNNNFKNVNTDPLSRAINSAEQDYRFILRNVLENSGDSNAYGNALTKLEKATKNLPQELQEEYANRFINDTQRIYEETQTVTPYELLGIRRSLGEKTPFGVEGAGQLNAYKQRIYGKITDRLHKLSPELERADRRYSAVKKYQDTKEGTKRILQKGENIDRSTTALNNFDSSYSKGNTSRNVRALEKLFTSEGYQPFTEDVYDIAAANDLNKINTTGLGSLAQVGKVLLTRPTLQGIRAYNRSGIPTIINNTRNLLNKVPDLKIPTLYDYLLNSSEQ